MAEKDRPGDDVPGDDVLGDATTGGEIPDDADDAVSRDGGVALAEAKDVDNPTAKKARARGPFGRLGGFFREVVSELRKVIWPTRKELLTYTTVVVVFVIVMVLLVSLFDFLFSQGVLRIFGGEPTAEG